MTTIIKKEDIVKIIGKVDVISAMEKGFIAYSNGKSVVPPVAELLFDKPKGETHIKYGYIKEDKYFVVKIASGFYENTKLGISSSQGLMLLFNQKTGQVQSVLLDEGYLTDIRTAAAGALVAKYFAPKQIKAVGMIGTGIQSRLQLQFLQQNNPCKEVWIWNRNLENSEKYKRELGDNFNICIASNPSELAQHCNLIYTTTPSTVPLLKQADIMPGTHITAVGSDTPEKQELESTILSRADIVMSDSISQSKSRGEIFKAVTNGGFSHDRVIELGTAIQKKELQRQNDQQISVADLTGVAVQDIMIAEAIYTHYKNNND